MLCGGMVDGSKLAGIMTGVDQADGIVTGTGMMVGKLGEYSGNSVKMVDGN